MRERVKERQIKTMRVSVKEAERERHTEVVKLFLEKQPSLVTTATRVNNGDRDNEGESKRETDKDNESECKRGRKRKTHRGGETLLGEAAQTSKRLPG